MESAMNYQQRRLVTSFLVITSGQNVEIASYFLKAANWKLDKAINHFFLIDTKDQTLTPEPSRPLSNLLFNGSFEDAKANSSSEDLWLLVHFQSNTKVPSLNLDLWSNDAVYEAIEFKFILWQVYHHTNKGKRISSFYKIDSAPPVVLLIDPVTGEMMRTWSGKIEPQSFLDDLRKYIDASPHEYISSVARNRRMKTEKICFDPDMATFSDDDFDDFDESEKETCLSSDLFEFPVLTEALSGVSAQLPWSFCYSHMDESEKKEFKLVQAIPDASKILDYGANATFDQSGTTY